MDREPQYAIDELTFTHWNQTVPVAVERDTEGRDSWILVRIVCEMIGVAHSPQYAVLQNEVNAHHYAGYLRPITMCVKGVARENLCLHRSRVPRWLDGISPSKVNNEKARAPLREFQEAVTKELDWIAFKYRGKVEQKGIIQSHSVTSFVFACECGRVWRVVNENGEWYTKRLRNLEEDEPG
jgi:P22_AR N-terminal domain